MWKRILKEAEVKRAERSPEIWQEIKAYRMPILVAMATEAMQLLLHNKQKQETPRCSQLQMVKLTAPLHR